MGKKNDPKYCRAIVICHGKCEEILVGWLKRTLRLKMELVTNEAGRSSIQIDSLMNILNNYQFRNRTSMRSKYQDIRWEKNQPRDFILFAWMDGDDTTSDHVRDFMNASLFAGHWLHECIRPIICQPNLEASLEPIGFMPHRCKTEAVKRFARENWNTREGIRASAVSLRQSGQTNLFSLLNFCLDWEDMNNYD